MKHIKWGLLAVAVVVAGYLNFGVFSYKGSVKEVKAFCENISTESNLSQIQSLVDSRKSLSIDGPIARDGKEMYIVDGKESGGRVTCTIETANGAVLNAKLAE